MAVTTKACHVVKPSSPTWSGILPLSELDQVGVITRTPMIYLYKKPPKNLHNPSIDTIINRLKESLSLALVSFYPLAGRLSPIGGARFELHCNAKGALLIQAESSNTCISDFGPEFSHIQMLEDLFPYVDYKKKSIHELPLLFVQVTCFRCGGFSIALRASHVIVDGQSGLHFLREWARLARGEPIEVVPFFDRQVLQGTGVNHGESLKDRLVLGNHHAKSLNDLPVLISDEIDLDEIKREEMLATTLALNKSQVDRLRKAANSMGIYTKHKGCPYSRYEVVAAHIWRCSSKARQHKSQQPTVLCFCVDSRSRINPPLPSSYFGNGIIHGRSFIRAGELVSRPLSHACSIIRAAIEKVNNTYVGSAIEYFKCQQSLSHYQVDDDYEFGNPNLSIVSWLNLPVRGMDFGWGNEVYVGPGIHACDGDITILPGYQNDGSLLVDVCLQAAYMNDFKKYFYEDVGFEPKSKI